jgi:probable HAF family extracellular repeat protein
MHAFVSANGVMTDIGGELGVSSDAFGINDLGQVVGRSYYGTVGGLRGFVYANGTATDLNELIDPASGWFIYEGSDINNNGQIAAYGFKPGFGTQALRLDPITSAVPEPAAMGMLLAGMATIALLFPPRRCLVAGVLPAAGPDIKWAMGVFSHLRSVFGVGLFGARGRRERVLRRF